MATVEIRTWSHPGIQAIDETRELMARDIGWDHTISVGPGIRSGTFIIAASNIPADYAPKVVKYFWDWAPDHLTITT